MADEPLINTYFESVTKLLEAEGDVKKRSEEFRKMNTDFDRYAYVQNIKAVEKCVKVPNCESAYRKSAELAQKYRVEGNKKFQSKEYLLALNLYNTCVLLAPPTNDEGDSNNELSLFYANRSAALYHLNSYQAALKDVRRAFTNKYPQNLHYKLYDREARCFLQLKQISSAVTAFENAKNALPKSNLDSKKSGYWEKEFTKGLLSCKKQNTLNLESLDINDKPVSPPSVFSSSHHTHFTSLSKACNVNYSTESGRYIIAEENMKPGDVILVEQPFASVLLPEHYETHCHHCYSRLVSVMACGSCSYVRFCGEKCKEEALKTYHKYECSILQSIHKSGVEKFGHLALRTISCKEPLLFKRFRETILDNNIDRAADPRLKGCNSSNVYSSQDYGTIYNLVGHSKSRTPNDLFVRTISAVYLLKCLEETTYFEDSALADDEDFKLFIGSLILSHLQSFPCNAHEISELLLDKTEVATSTCQEVGAGIYATLSLFNHSCDPAATRHFYGNSCVVRALRPITAGEEISDNYGAVFAVQNKSERQAKLKPQYYFTCGCLACERDWPLYHNIRSENPVWVCDKCKAALPKKENNSQTTNLVPCRMCGAENNFLAKRQALENASEKYYNGLGCLLDCNVQAATNDLIEALLVTYQHVEVPWRDVNNAQEALKQCFNTMGNCFINKDKH